MNSGHELIDALKMVAAEKGMDEDSIFEALELSLISACRKHIGLAHNINVDINRETGDVKVYAKKTVVEKVDDERIEISLSDAKKIDINYEIDDVIEIVVTPKDFDRISAQTAKQVVAQKFREFEHNTTYEQFLEKEGKIIIGVVERISNNNVIVNLGKTEAVLRVNDQIPGEKYNLQERIKLYLVSVKRTGKGVSLYVSRNHPNFVKCLFEQEVAEIMDGTIQIKNVVREPGQRTKIALHSLDENVDPIGSCIGSKRSRIDIILDEIGNEKIDLIKWNEDPKQYIIQAMSPAKIQDIIFKDKEKQIATVIVADNQVPLAIGKGGQNVRLAVQLTGWDLDVKTESQARELKIIE